MRHRDLLEGGSSSQIDAEASRLPERCVDLNDGSPNFELPMDTGLKWDRSMVDSFPGSDLECIGLCDSIVYLVCS